MTDERIAELMGWRWPTSVHPDDMLAKVRAVVHKAKTEWRGLTDDELMEILGYVTHGYIPDYTRTFVDAIETKLKEKNT